MGARKWSYYFEVPKVSSNVYVHSMTIIATYDHLFIVLSYNDYGKEDEGHNYHPRIIFYKNAVDVDVDIDV